jgi:hypothetical protein
MVTPRLRQPDGEACPTSGSLDRSLRLLDFGVVVGIEHPAHCGLADSQPQCEVDVGEQVLTHCLIPGELSGDPQRDGHELLAAPRP